MEITYINFIGKLFFYCFFEPTLIEKNPPIINKIPPMIFIHLLTEENDSGRVIKLNPRLRKYNPAIKLTINKSPPNFTIREKIKQTF
jgi:hypothetical protein